MEEHRGRGIIPGLVICSCWRVITQKIVVKQRFKTAINWKAGLLLQTAEQTVEFVKLTWTWFYWCETFHPWVYSLKPVRPSASGPLGWDQSPQCLWGLVLPKAPDTHKHECIYLQLTGTHFTSAAIKRFFSIKLWWEINCTPLLI